MSYRTHDSGKCLRGPNECPHLMAIEVILPVVIAICCRLADLCWGGGVTVVILIKCSWKEQACLQCSILVFFFQRGEYVSCSFFIDNAHSPIMRVLPGQLHWPSCAGRSPLFLQHLPLFPRVTSLDGAFWRKFSEHQFPPMKCPFIWSSRIGP